jgi:hypothetical protein
MPVRPGPAHQHSRLSSEMGLLRHAVCSPTDRAHSGMSATPVAPCFSRWHRGFKCLGPFGRIPSPWANRWCRVHPTPHAIRFPGDRSATWRNGWRKDRRRNPWHSSALRRWGTVPPVRHAILAERSRVPCQAPFWSCRWISKARLRRASAFSRGKCGRSSFVLVSAFGRRRRPAPGALAGISGGGRSSRGGHTPRGLDRGQRRFSSPEAAPRRTNGSAARPASEAATGPGRAFCRMRCRGARHANCLFVPLCPRVTFFLPVAQAGEQWA